MALLISIARATAFFVGAWVLAVWFIGMLYVAVSVIESLKYVPSRPAGAVLRTALRELWCVMWTQPLLPLFQLIARNMGSGGGDVPVVLVHGYFQNRVDFLYLARRLRRAGAGPLFAFNFFWPQSLSRSSATLEAFVAQVRERTGSEQVDLLTHSSGGLLALDVIASHPQWVRRAALVAVPLAGVPWRGPLVGTSGGQLRAGSEYTVAHAARPAEACIMSVYSPHDNVVHPHTTSEVPGADVSLRPVDGLGHLAILFDPTVGDLVCEFLLRGPERC